MARGKQTCKILKEIRRQIAEANGIEFVTSECRYRGDCLGTCPKCEAEVRYIEQQLRSRQRMGKAVALAGISAGMILMSGCSGTSSSNQSDETLQGVLLYTAEELDSIQEEEGELPMIEDSVSSLTPNNNGVKEGEISNEPNVVVTQGEMPDERSTMPDENGIYACAEQQPEFPGGPAEMMRFIFQHLRYPDGEGCVQGRVIVNFYVDTLGHVCEPKIFRGLAPAFDQEALRVVGLFPDFTPGRLNGKKVNVRMTIPISFKLSAD
mgnify:CR=1 FL=1